MITISKMTVGRPGGNGLEPILTNINCTLTEGTITLIAGQTGSGKSTFLNALAGLIPLQSGSVLYDGLPLWQGNRINDAVKFKNGILFQYPERQLFAESIRKEFLYSLRPLRLSQQETARRIEEAMERMKLPERLLRDSFFTLSDGQKRKVAMATTIAAKPEWLLLDEPTAGIDPLGIPNLLEAIAAHKQQQDNGVIVVSHDLDTFLPVADRVLVMHNGTIVADVSPKELCSNPGILLHARIGMPASVEISDELLEHGITLAGTPLTPDETAAEIIRHLQEHSTAPFASSEPLQQQTGSTDGPLAENRSVAADAAAGPLTENLSITNDAAARPLTENLSITNGAAARPLKGYQSAAAEEAESGPRPILLPAAANPAELPPAAGSSAARRKAVQQLHPIAKWLLYIIISTGMLIQDQWFGIGVAAIIACLCIYLSGAAYSKLIRPLKPFMLFIVISAIISGLSLSFNPDSISLEHIGFSWTAATRTIRQLSVFLLMMLPGILFAVTTSPQAMQRGLEQSLSFLERFRMPVAAFTFSASLLLRFVPMLFAEIDRVSIITRARGKSHVKQGSIRLRDAHVFMIPLILSMMKHAEDLAFALEARGYKAKRISRVSYNRLAFQKNDWLSIAWGILIFVVLIVCDLM